MDNMVTKMRKASICDVCGKDLMHGEKRMHFEAFHTEYKFALEKDSNGHNRLRCLVCKKLVEDYGDLVKNHLHDNASRKEKVPEVPAPEKKLDSDIHTFELLGSILGLLFNKSPVVSRSSEDYLVGKLEGFKEGAKFGYELTQGARVRLQG
jgi:hypothetical protein